MSDDIQKFRITQEEWKLQQSNITEIKDCLLGTLGAEGLITNTKTRLGILELFRLNIIKFNWLLGTTCVGLIASIIKMVVF